MALTRTHASRFAALALSHVTREYPNKLDHVLNGPGDLQSPRALHPVFFGSFDWHSCVHGYWLLSRVYRRFPALPEAKAIRETIDRQLTDENVAGELAYLAQPLRAGFERPYGWAWLLMLAAELAQHDSREGQRWYRALTPLAKAFEQRLMNFLPKATYPVRAGVHSNTAFALRLGAEYAEAVRDEGLLNVLREKARTWYGMDRDCQAWEPAGDDFLSPALIEAECMRRLLPAAQFASWMDGFLPRLAQHHPRSLFEPAIVSDRSDGKIAHLDGLNLSRAWCWRELASAWPEADRQTIELVVCRAFALGMIVARQGTR
jgi:hypothetical protein